MPCDITRPYRRKCICCLRVILYRQFSCTPDHNILGNDISGISAPPRKFQFMPHALGGTNANGECIYFPIPFRVPPSKYTGDDVPWTWDSQHLLPDVHGRVLEQRSI